jgi:cobalt-zinc-cadmium efflux system outer membrane protein
LPDGERPLVVEVLDRNPDLARLAAVAAAAGQRSPQSRALPDPALSVTGYAWSPETRVGPQRFAIGLSQRLPWSGKRSLREEQAVDAATAARAELDARRLSLLTEVRRILYELAFLDAQEEAIREDRATLVHFEELARARYASGVGLQQAPVKLQAEITKDDNRLLELEGRRIGLVAQLNALRDRPAGTVVEAPALPASLPELALDPAALRGLALEARPELRRARALIEASRTGSEIAELDYRPDFTLGLGYTIVDERRDAPGRLMPPEGNGDDILGFTLGVSLPVWRSRLEAGVGEAAARELAAQEELRVVANAVEQALADLVERLPVVRRQVGLFETLLAPQAEEALRSVEVAYSSGSAGALDLVDAERVLLDVRIGTARARADYWIALAHLEGAVGAPLDDSLRGEAR